MDDDHLVWFGDRWCAVSDALVPATRLLVERFGDVVRHDELVAACAANGGSDHRGAVKATMGRVDLGHAAGSDSRSYYEIKYRGPDNQVIDITASGWIGT